MEEFHNDHLTNKGLKVVNSFKGIQAHVLKSMQDQTKAHYASPYDFLNAKDPDRYSRKAEEPFIDLTNADELPDADGGVLTYEALKERMMLSLQCKQDKHFMWVDAPTDNEVMAVMDIPALEGKGPAIDYYKKKWLYFRHKEVQLMFKVYHGLNKKDAPIWAEAITNVLHTAVDCGWVTSLDDINKPPKDQLVVLCERSHYDEIQNMGNFSSESENGGEDGDEDEHEDGENEDEGEDGEDSEEDAVNNEHGKSDGQGGVSNTSNVEDAAEESEHSDAESNGDAEGDEQRPSEEPQATKGAKKRGRQSNQTNSPVRTSRRRKASPN